MAKGVLKEISKLNKVPHPRSRKTAQLARKAIRSSNRDKAKTANLMKQNLLGEKFMWFKERIESAEGLMASKVLGLIESYLGRFDEELEQIQIKHSVGNRKGRQHASREDSIKSTKKQEINEFNTYGIAYKKNNKLTQKLMRNNFLFVEVPDLLNSKQLSMLMKWGGELRFLQNFKVVRYSRSHLENLIKRRKGEEQSDLHSADEEQGEFKKEVEDGKEEKRDKSITENNAKDETEMDTN